MTFNLDISQYEYPSLVPMQQDWRWCHKYAHDILTGKIPSCQKMKWVAMRHFNDLQRDDIYFDEESAASIVAWFKFCPIIKGLKAGKPTVLDPSQIFIACSVIAWRWSEDVFEVDDETGIEMQVRHADKRRYNQMYAQVSRKYGKTTFTAGLKLYLMYKFNYGPRVFSLATKRDQAKEVWSVAKKMINLSPRLSQIFQPRANDILLPSKEGEFKPLASDSNSLDGLDPMAACLDECHAIKDRNLYGVLISAFGANEGGEYLFSVITTAGFILDGLCTDLYKNGTRVLDPDDPTEQDNYFYVIFEIDKDDDWADEKAWFKSNPALVYGRPSIQYLRDRFNEACLSIEEKANFITKHCNLFVSGSDKWLDMDIVNACEKPLGKNYLDPVYQNHEVYIGIDRARVNDITSAAILFPMNDGGIDLFFHNMLPKVTADSVTDYLKSKYHRAVEMGDLDLVESPTVRDSDVKETIRKLNQTLKPKAIYYDPWHMREIAQDLEDEGIPMVAVSQGTGNMSEPAKKLEGLLAEGLVRVDSILFRYACECAMMRMSMENNMKIYRLNDKTEKIDPLIATIIALSGATLIKLDKNIYEERGMLSV